MTAAKSFYFLAETPLDELNKCNLYAFCEVLQKTKFIKTTDCFCQMGLR